MNDGLTLRMAEGSAGVAVWFEGSVHSFTKTGAPAQLNYRERLILRALLDAAIADLDAQSGSPS